MPTLETCPNMLLIHRYGANPMNQIFHLENDNKVLNSLL